MVPACATRWRKAVSKHARSQTQISLITSTHLIFDANQALHLSITNMQSISTIVVAFGLLASQVTATIALGNNANNICKLTASIDSPRRTCWESAVMWIYSDNSCSGVVIPSSPVNVSNGFNCKYCLSTDNSNRRRTVRLANGPIYVDIVRGCGTDTWWIDNNDGSFAHKRARISPPSNTDCGVQLTWKR
jgi:hypothetical protein